MMEVDYYVAYAVRSQVFDRVSDQRPLRNGIAGFVRSSVSGQSLVPNPAASIIAFIS